MYELPYDQTWCLLWTEPLGFRWGRPFLPVTPIQVYPALTWAVESAPRQEGWILSNCSRHLCTSRVKPFFLPSDALTCLYNLEVLKAPLSFLELIAFMDDPEGHRLQVLSSSFDTSRLLFFSLHLAGTFHEVVPEPLHPTSLCLH